MDNKQPLVLSELQKRKERGMQCLECGGHRFFTAWTRHYTNRTVRSKVCRACGRRHTTAERVVK